MFITRKHLSRRMVLKGVGAALALPFLDAMVPAATALARTAASPGPRLGFFYIPHGAVQGDTRFGPDGDRWTPSGTGRTFKLNVITQPLEPFKQYVSTIGNLENAAGVAGPQHLLNPATWLSCTRPAGIPVTANSRGVARGANGTPTPAAPFPTVANMATTLDQIIAARYSGKTAMGSLEVASESTLQQAAGGNGAFYTTLSFRDATTPLPMEYNPKKVFNALFGIANSPQEAISDLKERKSLLDLTRDQTKALKGKLGAGDKVVLESYLDSVREVERQTDKSAKTWKGLEKDLADIMLPGRPAGPLDSFDAQVKLMFDLIAIAYQADITRVASFIMAAEGTNQTYNHIGVPDSFHPLSHHANDPDKIAKLVKIQTWHMKAFADFLAKMSEIQDGDGTLLDHSIFLYGSNMGNSDSHSNSPIPTVIVGGGNGRMKKGGQHLALPERTPLANVHLTLLRKVGIEQKQFADSTGTISKL